MFFKFWLNILIPVLAGVTYFIMALETKRLGHVRKLIFGEIGYKKVFSGFLMFGIYLITRPLQNILGPHPWPMIINCIRQFFLMAVIAPAILVGIFHWASKEGEVQKSSEIAPYVLGFFMALIFILINMVAIDGSRVIVSWKSFNLHDAVWFYYSPSRIELTLIHLIVQSICPVGFFALAAGYVRHKRHNYPSSSIYNLMPLKWQYLETGLIVLCFSFLAAGLTAFLGHYYTYLWVIYFIGAIVSGLIELKGVKIPPRAAPQDLAKK